MLVESVKEIMRKSNARVSRLYNHLDIGDEECMYCSSVKFVHVLNKRILIQ